MSRTKQPAPQPASAHVSPAKGDAKTLAQAIDELTAWLAPRISNRRQDGLVGVRWITEAAMAEYDRLAGRVVAAAHAIDLRLDPPERRIITKQRMPFGECVPLEEANIPLMRGALKLPVSDAAENDHSDDRRRMLLDDELAPWQAWLRSIRAAAEAMGEGLAARTPDPAGNGETADDYAYVDSAQIAALAHVSKDAIQKYRYHKDDKKRMTEPDRKGGGGRPNQWKWTNIQPWLERTFGRQFPIDPAAFLAR
jgi:hypothetical protein